jgi:hypothetical protein
MLVQPQRKPGMTPEAAVDDIKRLRQGITLGGFSIREMIEEGRM